MGNDSVVDLGNDSSDLSSVVQDLQAATEQPVAANTAEPANQNSPEGGKPDWIEDKFWTGNVEESAGKQHDSYKSLQSAYGRMANDLGSQRKLTDQVLGMKREDDLHRNTPERVQVEGADLLDKPNETLDAYIEPKLSESNSQMNERLGAMETALAQQAFVAAHPDYNDIANDPAFSTWANGSPYRATVSQKAVQGDYGAAHELLSEWKLRKQSDQSGNQAAEQAGGDDVDAARAAGLESTASGQSTGSGKVYRRSDLIRLKLEKPDVYEDARFQDEILKAYAEGRVK